MFRGHRIVTMLVSLLAAVLLWLYVVTVVAPETTTRVSEIPISIDGTFGLEERGLKITAQDVQSLALELSTSRMNLTKLNADSIRINADASRIREPGEYTLTCTVTFPDTVRSSDIDIIGKSRDSVKITVSRMEKKSIPVRLNWSGAVKEGFFFEAESVTMDPDEITVYGPDYEVEQIKEAVINYDISTLEETALETLPITFLNEQGEEVTFSEYTSADVSQVSLILPVLRTKEIRLAVDIVEGGGIKKENAKITLNPETIQVKGPVDVIDGLDDTYILGEVKLKTVSDRDVLHFNLLLPAGVTNISGEPEVTAAVRLTGVKSDAISVSDIRLINIPAGYQAEASTRTARVTIRGSTEEIKEIKQNAENGIYILVDLADNTQTGAFPVPGRVINPKHPAVSTEETVEIGVVISGSETGGYGGD